MGMEPIKHPSLCQVTSLALSEYGDIVVFCRDQSNGVLCRYSINGKLLSKDLKLKESIVDMFVFDEFLVTGGVHGRLEIRTLHRYDIISLLSATAF